MKRFSFLCAVAVCLNGCSPYAVREFSAPETPVPEKFVGEENGYADTVGREADTEQSRPYWQEYQNATLNELQEEALTENFSIEEAAARVMRARAQAQVAGAGQFPAYDLSAGGNRSRIDIGTPSFNDFRPQGVNYENNFFLRNGLSFEIDLWQRVASGLRAEELRVLGTEADLENTKLVVSDNLVQAWLGIKEAMQLEQVLEKQIENSKTFLELTELRFTVSQGTALDVFEQRQQLASLQSQLPRIRLGLRQSQNALGVLTTTGSGDIRGRNFTPEYPEVPPLPPTIRPVDLIVLRPDLRAILADLQANEYDVARAVADRYPRLAIGMNYEFSTDDFDDLFPNDLLTGFFDVLFPIMDGGQRSGVVKREQAEVQESIARFSRRFLEALQEVEDALSAERYQSDLLQRLREQLAATQDSLRESKSRYMNGVVDYLRVLVALQSGDTLERTIISEEKERLLIRNRLYLALGGKVFSEKYVQPGGAQDPQMLVQ